MPLAPLAFALASVALGLLLATAPGVGPRAIGPVRTFALAAAATVVLLHLLPDALERLGLLALAGLAGGLALPTLLERAGARGARLLRRGGAAPAGGTDAAPGGPSPLRLAAEVSYAGLLAHHVGDGIGLWLYGAGPAASFDVALALAAHTVPLSALVVLRFGGAGRRGAGVARAAGLAAASGAGVALGALVGPERWAPLLPWVAAVVSGILLHFVAHDLDRDLPRTAAARAADLAALAAGVGLTLAGTHAHARAAGHADALGDAVAHALADLAMATAPPLLAGLLAGALWKALRGGAPEGPLGGGGASRQALRGILHGARAPVCDCGVLPVARSLALKGAGAPLVVAFAVAAPLVGVETFAVTARFLGGPFAAARLGLSLAAALLAALVVARLAPPARRPLPLLPAAPGAAAAPAPPLLSRFVAAFDDAMLHVAPWVLAGLVPAAYAHVALAPGDLAPLAESGLDLPLVALVAAPAYVCAASATPLGAVLLAKGLSPGAVLAGLVLGPAVNAAMVAFLARPYGRASAAGALATVAGASIGAGLVANRWLGGGSGAGGASIDIAAAHEHAPLAVAGAAALGLLILRSLFLSGARAWAAAILAGDGRGGAHARERREESASAACHGQALGHGHAHEHEGRGGAASPGAGRPSRHALHPAHASEGEAPGAGDHVHPKEHGHRHGATPAARSH